MANHSFIEIPIRLQAISRLMRRGCGLMFLALAFSAGCTHESASSAASSQSTPQPAKAADFAELSEFLAMDPAPSQDFEIVPQFHDVALRAGIDFTYYNDFVPNRFFLPEVMGGGVGWVDYDGDGWLDLYVMNGCQLENPDPQQTKHLNRLYRNRGDGTFTEVTLSASAHQAGYGQGCAVGDYNSDGFPDLYLTNYGENALLLNNGDGTYSDITEPTSVGDSLWGTSAVWWDVNQDGYLDLYVVNYLNVAFENCRKCKYSGIWGYCGPGEYRGEPDRLYLNQGDGTFIESAELLGFQADNGKGLAVVAADFDEDLRPDLYVANDMTANFLFTRSRPPGVDEFRKTLYGDIAMEIGCATAGNGQNEASMGIACADFDNDGRIDLFLTHFYGQKNTLYRNLGNFVFDDDSQRSRVAATSFDTIGFGTVPLDYDRDGSFDLFVANGHVLGPNYEVNELRPQLLHNDGGAVFGDISASAGSYFEGKYLGRGAAAADFDNDGDVDLAVTHLYRSLALLRNDTETERHFLGLSLQTPDRIPPVGGRVIVRVGPRRIVVPITAGGSYLCSNDSRMLFGLENATGPVQVEIHWPSGRWDELELETDRYWFLIEGRPAIRFPVQQSAPQEVASCGEQF